MAVWCHRWIFYNRVLQIKKNTQALSHFQSMPEKQGATEFGLSNQPQTF